MKPTPPTPPPDSDGLEWLRAIRRKITSEFDHDQKKMGDRIVRSQPRLVPAKP